MRSLELFAGCGGLALGMARAGFRHDMVVEFDRDAIETLHLNKERKIEHVKHWNINGIDARTIDYSSLGVVDVLSGGPPCQPFSIGGKHLGPSDPRNMWPEAIRAIRETRPRAFVLENVRGLFRPAFADYLDYITLQLSYPDISPAKNEIWEEHLRRLRQYDTATLGKKRKYRVLAKTVNAADYGAAQKRHRAIFIGIDTKYGEDWCFPPPTHSQEALAWSKHIDFSYWQRHQVRRIHTHSSKSETWALRRAQEHGVGLDKLPWMTVRDAISDLPRPTKSESISGHWQHPGARIYPNHTGSRMDEPAKALKAGDHGVPGGENMVVNSLGNVRYFTVREMARLQGFPDDFNIFGSWKAATRQLGNAVPTVMAEQMAIAVKKVLGDAP